MAEALAPSPKQLLTESLIFWVIALVLFVGRLWARSINRKSKGIVRVQADDWLMTATFYCYSLLLVLIELSGRFGTNETDITTIAQMPPKDPNSIEAAEYRTDMANRILGSKIVVGSNQCYLATIWGAKACLLILYYNLSKGTRQAVWVKLVAIYAVVGLIACELSLLIACRPFSLYWAYPSRNKQCSTYHNYCIVQTVFNISSDLLILALPIPMMKQAKLPRSKKILLSGIFSLGVFVILAAGLNKYYNFTQPNVPVYMVWHIREASTSIMVANMMCWWPLLSKVFHLPDFLNRSSNDFDHASEGSRAGIVRKLGINLTSLKDNQFGRARPGDHGVESKAFDTDDVSEEDLKFGNYVVDVHAVANPASPSRSVWGGKPVRVM